MFSPPLRNKQTIIHKNKITLHSYYYYVRFYIFFDTVKTLLMDSSFRVKTFWLYILRGYSYCYSLPQIQHASFSAWFTGRGPSFALSRVFKTILRFSFFLFFIKNNILIKILIHVLHSGNVSWQLLLTHKHDVTYADVYLW